MIKELLGPLKEVLAKELEIRENQTSSEAFFSQVDGRLQAIEKKILECFNDVYNRISTLDSTVSKFSGEMGMLPK